nr:hypothetical protein [Stenotrophomonas maltophilia]
MNSDSSVPSGFRLSKLQQLLNLNFGGQTEALNRYLPATERGNGLLDLTSDLLLAGLRKLDVQVRDLAVDRLVLSFQAGQIVSTGSYELHFERSGVGALQAEHHFSVYGAASLLGGVHQAPVEFGRKPDLRTDKIFVSHAAILPLK